VANKLLKTTKVGGGKCAVKIYRNSEYDTHEIKTFIGKKLVGSSEESGAGAKAAARMTAAHEARWLKKQPGCRRA
jgi:hypothetical protein